MQFSLLYIGVDAYSSGQSCPPVPPPPPPPHQPAHHSSLFITTSTSPHLASLHLFSFLTSPDAFILQSSRIRPPSMHITMSQPAAPPIDDSPQPAAQCRYPRTVSISPFAPSSRRHPQAPHSAPPSHHHNSVHPHSAVYMHPSVAPIQGTSIINV